MLGDMSNITMREQCHPEAEGLHWTCCPVYWASIIIQQSPITHHDPHLSLRKKINPAYMVLKAVFSIFHLTHHPGSLSGRKISDGQKWQSCIFSIHGPYVHNIFQQLETLINDTNCLCYGLEHILSCQNIYVAIRQCSAALFFIYVISLIHFGGITPS